MLAHELKRDSDSISSYRALAETRRGATVCGILRGWVPGQNPVGSGIGRKIDLVRSQKSYSDGPNTASIFDFSVAALNGLTM